MSKLIVNEYVPDVVSAPGETLLEILEDRGITQQELADRLGMTSKTINEIIKGKAPLSHDTSLALERVLGISAGFWNRLESAYQEYLTRQRDRERLRDSEKWLDTFPIKKMIENHYITRRNTVAEQMEELLRFLCVASPSDWSLDRVAMAGRYRHSSTRLSDENALGAWLQRGVNIAREQDCVPYDAGKFQETLNVLRGCTSEAQEIFLPKMVRLCAASGVAVALVPALPKAAVCGFTRWLNPNKALLQLSDRYKRRDIFWFTFFHEAGHILKHGKKDTFLELEKMGEKNEKEQEADRFAADHLIPSTIYRQIKQDKPYSRAKICGWAEQAGIAPDIIVGRLRHERLMPNTDMADLLHPINLTVYALQVNKEV